MWSKGERVNWWSSILDATDNPDLDYAFGMESEGLYRRDIYLSMCR